MDLINPRPNISMENVHLFGIYTTHVEKLSSDRQSLFGAFMTIHLVLLPAQAAIVGKESPIVSELYSVLVGMLGIFICVVSYRRIKSIFTRIDEGYKLIREIENEFPFRFFTVLGLKLRFVEEGGEQKGSLLHRTELVVHWVFGCIYASLPFIHSYIGDVISLFK